MDYTTWILPSLLLISGLTLKAHAKKGFGKGEQDWGYVNVRPKANLFWWLYYVDPVPKPHHFDVFKYPLLIWLQGGPGSSSSGFGNFVELGPLDYKLHPRNHSWVYEYNILYIDSPVGTGFSYIESLDAYSRTNGEISVDLLRCITQFLHEQPGFQITPTYILGESYGGKNAVELAHLWINYQKLNFIKSNLKGLALGDSWISPIDSVQSYAPYLYHTGMIDTSDFKGLKNVIRRIAKAIKNEEWREAKVLMDVAMMKIGAATDNVDVYNILKRQLPPHKRKNLISDIPDPYNVTSYDDQLEYVMNDVVKKALGLKPDWKWKIISWKVYNSLSRDFMRPVTNYVESLLNGSDLKIVVYNGQLDLIVPVRGTLTWVEKLQWKHRAKWYKAPRRSFNVNGVVHGYIKQFRNLKMFWINRAGHMVPKDNPYATSAILRSLTSAN